MLLITDTLADASVYKPMMNEAKVFEEKVLSIREPFL